jgi:hypothetical protein
VPFTPGTLQYSYPVLDFQADLFFATALLVCNKSVSSLVQYRPLWPFTHHSSVLFLHILFLLPWPSFLALVLTPVFGYLSTKALYIYFPPFYDFNYAHSSSLVPGTLAAIQ